MPQEESVTHLAIVQVLGLVTQVSTESKGFSTVYAAEDWARKRIELLGGAHDVASVIHYLAEKNAENENLYIITLTSKVTPVWAMVIPCTMRD